MNFEKVASIIREASAEEIVPRFKHLSAGQIREKRPGELVTEADTEAERVMTGRLRDLLPGSAVVGEEAVAADPALLKLLEGQGSVWIIDPVDGTANFAKGNARFAVIVALVRDGVTVAGWIFDPLGERMITAELGGGAWSGSQRLTVLPVAPLAELTGSVKRSGRLSALVAKTGRKGSAAHDYLDLVTGQLHFAHYNRLMPWDHAAGVLIHAEAGGYAALTDGRPYRPRAEEGCLLLAPSPGTWTSLRAVID
ncbi:Inositol-1-monophosphatase [Paramagnetospirillum magnetotacticum MS-1]|uniref:Inositol-1-monophosphatase n=1 Tax=Paramagnetospirillum magnetotacticum MS-1 TaxID=272627 RepID=A0A0C2UBE6_PARME|nr:inositol monophosphatase family protein [Paramagnetospirillum magnetotacticum]KIL98817.1 Inositol-1-monophosphatase [Paramagnetospirillum magnetotacticum MS-1]